MSDTIIKKAFEAKVYSLTALSNMHVGSGKNNYGIIDNLVQRDTLSNFPTINSSSLKGALREYFGHILGDREDALIRYVFGADTKADSKSKAGEYRFFSGQMMSMPVRSNARPYYNATCPIIIETFLNIMNTFGIEIAEKESLQAFVLQNIGDALYFDVHQNGIVSIEDLDLKASKGHFDKIANVEKYFGENLVLLSNEKFKSLTNDDHLPIIARNHLENGVSKNLWYEQIIPRQSRFYFVLLHTADEEKYKIFRQGLETQPVQIGANASIGYGFSQIKLIQ